MDLSSALSIANEGRSLTGSEFCKGCVLAVAEDMSSHNRKIFKTLSLIPELVHIFHDNWEYIYLNNLNCSHVSSTIIHWQRMEVMTSQTLNRLYLFMSSMFSKSLYYLSGCKAAKICSCKERKCLLLRRWPEKKLTYVTTDSGRNVCDRKASEAG
jgi:hypothetical protein